MARNLTTPNAGDQATTDEANPADVLRVAQQGDGAAPALSPDEPGARPAAADDCAVTDQETVLRLPVLDNDDEGLGVISVTQPASGEASIAEDGTIRFTPDQPGHQEIGYQVSDGEGGTTDARAHVFVNPTDGAIGQAVLDGAAPGDLAALARACADGMALDIARLAGDRVTIEPPAPGQRIQVSTTAGQEISIEDPSFVQATFLNVDGGLLLIAEDGRMIFLEGFSEASAAGDPVTLSIGGSDPVAGARVLEVAMDVDRVDSTRLANAGGDGEAILPAAGQAHGGGAGFSPYDPGSIGTGPDALGPQAPTALDLGTTEILFDSPRDSELSPLGDSIVALDPFDPGDPEGPGGPGEPEAPFNQAPTISINANIAVDIGEVTVGGPTFVEGPLLPDLAENRPVGGGGRKPVNGDNLVVGEGGDTAIIFRDEVALFKNSVGVYLIGENGEMLDPKMVFSRSSMPIRSSTRTACSSTPSSAQAAARSAPAIRSC